MHRFIALVLLSPTWSKALEAPQSIGLHTLSVHSASGYNGINPGVYAIWPNGVTGGAFYNSYERNSVYAGWLWRFDAAQRFGALLGAATGYGSTTETMVLAPLVAPTFRWAWNDGMSARVTWFPDPRRGAVQVLHLSFEWAWNKPVR